ncbi:MAG: SMC-Scp complex subunit ScpB [Planctomycetaceae bacterium]
MISSSPPPDELPDDRDALDEELISQDEIEEAYQRALAAFESAQAETETDDDFPNPADPVAGPPAGNLAPPAPGPAAAAAAATGLSPDSLPVSDTASDDEIPVDLTSWTDDEAGDLPAAAELPSASAAAVDPAEALALEEQAHAEFEALQAQLPPETQAAWQAETLAASEPSPAAPTAQTRFAPPASRVPPPAAPQPNPADVNVTPSQVIEAALFVGGQALTAGKLYALLRGAITVDQVPELIDELNTLYAAQERPYEIRLGDGGYRLELRPEYDRLRARVFGQGPREVRLSQDLLEVLALVAYRQPITQEEIEALGKASPGNQLRQLLRRELIQLERDPEQPKEVRYRTTERFLSVFGLANLADLPQPDDLAAR